MELIFQGGNEVVKLVIDRANKQLQVSSSQTNYELIPAKWSMLFDKGRETIQERITDRLNDEDFRKAIIAAMAQQGYMLKC